MRTASASKSEGNANEGQISDSQSQSSKPVRLDFKYALFTYKTHIDKDSYTNFIYGLYSDAQVTVAHETADDSNPYEHTHSVLKMPKRVTIRNMRKFDFNDIHPHIKVLPGPKAYQDAIKYISKEDPDVEQPEEEIPLAYQVWECKTVHDAVTKFVKKPSDFSGIRNLYLSRPFIEDTDAPDTLLPWQQYMDTYIQNTNDNRHIHWVYDPIGNTGKSVFTKYLQNLYTNRMLLLTEAGNTRDIANILLQQLTEGNTLEYLIFDLPRNYQMNSEFYNILEMIKNGRMTGTKFQGSCLKFKNKCLVVFSNHKPSEYVYTYDRVKLTDLQQLIGNNPLTTRQEKEEIELESVPIQQVREERDKLLQRLDKLQAIINRYENHADFSLVIDGVEYIDDLM